jgi:GTP pyrophosphokinase
MREHFKAPANFELYYRIGRGFITVPDIKKFIENKPAHNSRSKAITQSEPKSPDQEFTQM